jgi:hypothetical protein
MFFFDLMFLDSYTEKSENFFSNTWDKKCCHAELGSASPFVLIG